ncbi:MAG: hypothetical protein ACHQ52_00760 [Candidatus Eisenbacteria bacterium]
MRPHPAFATALAALMLIEGCSVLTELPREGLADQPEQRDVVVEMRSGEKREFDSARFGPDSLWGFRRSEDSGDVPELSTTALPMDSVTRVSVRHLDWYRTGLGAAAVVGAGVALALSQRKSSTGGEGTPEKPPPARVGGRKR